MTFQEKIEELKKDIFNELSSLVKSDYLYLELPYYSNIGDILIWEGTEAFLEKLPYKCLYKTSMYTFKYKAIPEDSIILLQGGGTFGDIWRKNQDFRLSIIEQYPNNKIIILPQTVYYENEEKLKEDAYLMSLHKNLIICARDTKSREILTTHFLNRVLLLPDMAFCIDMPKWKKYKKQPINKILFLNRKDKEKNDQQSYMNVPTNAEDRDWPTIERRSFAFKLLDKILNISKDFDKLFSSNLYNAIFDFSYKHIIRESYIKKGIKFLSPYSFVYTTRLHVAILSILLEKDFVFFDNSYGKNKYFYETWLKDLDGVKFE